jgi:hypothetical protein
VVAGCKAGRHDTVWRQHEGAECLVLGVSIIRNVESKHVRVQCFPGIRTEQLLRVMENRDLGSPDTVVIHVGTTDLRQTENLDVMGDMYTLVNKAKIKFPQSRLFLSGVLRRRDVMAADRSIKWQIRLDSEDTGNYICRSEQLNWELGLRQGWTAHEPKWSEANCILEFVASAAEGRILRSGCC